MSEHSELGASGCKRWWNCPGSVALSRGVENRSSPYAEEGTKAHALAEACLTNGQAAIEYVDRTCDAEMAEHVQVYLDECRNVLRWAGAKGHVVEQRFSLAAIDPPAPMFGTADFVVWSTEHLWVYDLKYGQGVQVEAEGNPQLRYYALGALLALPQDVGRTIRGVTMQIVQPRAPGGPAIRTAHISTLDLMEWSIELIDRAWAAMQTGAALNPGTWCKFCPASGRCPAQRDLAHETARAEFSVTLLTPAQIGEMLSRADALEQYLTDLRVAATAEISRGGAVPGWKLVPTKPRQAWRDTAEAAETLDMLHDLGDDRFTPRELVSPAVARGLLANRLADKHPTKKAAETAARAALDPLLTSSSIGVKLVAVSDTRLALPAAGTEFTALPAIKETT